MRTYYYTHGSVRGSCGHVHRRRFAAQKCLDRDKAGCRAQGGYSDRVVMVWREGEKIPQRSYGEGDGRPAFGRGVH